MIFTEIGTFCDMNTHPSEHFLLKFDILIKGAGQVDMQLILTLTNLK